MLPLVIIGLVATFQTGSDDPFQVSNDIRRRTGQPEVTRDQFNDQQRLSRERAASYEQRAVAEAGFAPAVQIAQTGADVRRVRFTDPYLFLQLPGVTLTRTSKGVRIDLTSSGRARTATAVAPVGVWAELGDLELAAMSASARSITSTKRFRVGDPIPSPPPICHGWGARVDIITKRRVQQLRGHSCDADPRERATLAYANRVAEIAADAVPACRMETQGAGLDRLGRCFGRFNPHTTADP